MTQETRSLLIKIAGVAALIVFGIVARLVPHWPDMTPITAIIFAGTLFWGTRWALPSALAALAISDFMIGGYDWRLMAVVYGSFALVSLGGIVFARTSGFWKRTGILVGTSFFFFLTTNFAVWLFSPLYPHTLAGLMESYVMGLPFFRNMLVGDLIYTGALVGAFSWLRVPMRTFVAHVRHAA